jgi:hypothetical protein
MTSDEKGCILWTIQPKDISYTKNTPGCKQLNFMGVDALRVGTE